MGSKDAAQTRELNRVGVLTHNKDDEPIAIRLRYVGTGSVTSVTVTAATNIVMVTSDGGTDTYTFAAYTTVGTLVDAINADAIFEAKVLDGLRSDATASKFANGAITSSVQDGITVWDVLTDTDALDKLSVCVTPDRGFSLGTALKDRKLCRIKKLSYRVNLSGATAGTVRIYKRVGSTETLVTSYISVDDTVTTPVDYTASDTFITVKPGEEFIFSVQDATVTDSANNYVEALYDVL